MAKGGRRKTDDTAEEARHHIVWFRNDLRLADNASLRAACEGADESDGKVLALFVLDRASGGDWALGGASLWWLHHSLESLSDSLKKAGAALVLREGDAAEIVPALAREIGACAVHCGIAHEPAAREATEAVARALPDGCRLERHRVATLFGFDEVMAKSGDPYSIYTPYRNAARELDTPAPPQKPPKRIPGLDGVSSDRLDDWKLRPTAPDWAGGLRDTWTPGEAGAAERLKTFVADHLEDYDEERDRPANRDGTSMLSPHLHWGELSPNQAWDAVSDKRGKGRKRFEDELLWHEFAAYALWHDPTLPDSAGKPVYEKLPWRNDRDGLRAWQKGRTGVPIVDAGLRQLWQIGWMHNRVRMITASYLIKHQLIHWREGEAWFWDTLVDADLATNAMSWQWVAGTGVENQPFFRVFNPLTQAKRFDPDGAYVRRWVTELEKLPDKWVHAPWLAPPKVLEEAGIELGRDYPEPVVGIDEGRDRALDAFRKHVKGKSAGSKSGKDAKKG